MDGSEADDGEETEYDREFIGDDDIVCEESDIHRQLDMQRVEEEESELRRTVREEKCRRREERTMTNPPDSAPQDSIGHQEQVRLTLEFAHPYNSNRQFTVYIFQNLCNR